MVALLYGTQPYLPLSMLSGLPIASGGWRGTRYCSGRSTQCSSPRWDLRWISSSLGRACSVQRERRVDRLTTDSARSFSTRSTRHDRRYSEVSTPPKRKVKMPLANPEPMAVHPGPRGEDPRSSFITVLRAKDRMDLHGSGRLWPGRIPVAKKWRWHSNVGLGCVRLRGCVCHRCDGEESMPTWDRSMPSRCAVWGLFVRARRAPRSSRSRNPGASSEEGGSTNAPTLRTCE
jgi:hypothetical protein